MWKNYLAAALNNLFKNKLYSAINIIGLAIGLVACILISLYVQDELSYDRHWQSAGQIYRVNNEIQYPGADANKADVTPLNLLPALRSYFPSEIDIASRVRAFGLTDMMIDNTVYGEQLALVDPEFIEIFEMETLSGSLVDTLSTVNNIALSEELATKFFASADPIGKTISVPRTFMFAAKDFTVTAVYRQPAENSVLSAPSLALLDEGALPDTMSSWTNNILNTYVRLHEGVDVARVNDRFPELIKQYALIPDTTSQNGAYDADEMLRYSLQPITDIYLNPWSESDKQDSGNKTTNLIFGLIASLVLVIACINFAVLTTARSTRRQREVAMRKLLGAKRGILVAQFLGEAILIALLATLLGLVLLELIMPLYASFAGKELSLDYSSPTTYLLLLGLILISGIAGGFYPAIVMSAFKPGKSLSNAHLVNANSTSYTRGALVVFQFFVSVSLIIATTFVYLQSNFASSSNLGFNPDRLLVVEGVFDIEEIRQGRGNQSSLLKQKIDNLDGVISSTLSMIMPADGQIISNPITFQSENNPEKVEANFRQNYVGFDFLSTYEIPIVAGRDYSENIQRDRIPLVPTEVDSGQLLEFNIIINEAAVQRLGLSSAEDAIGKVITTNVGMTSLRLANLTIVGVAADARFHYLRTETPPEMYMLTPELTAYLTVRFYGEPAAILSSISELWPEFYSNTPFRTQFIDQVMDDQFADVRIQGSMLAGFSLLAVILACLGLLGMSAFSIDRRTKEIGLRKVMGAKVRDIVRLLVWQFSKPVLIANLIAWPITVWIMIRWLEGFSNRIDSMWLLPLCLAAGIISLLFMWITVAGNTTRIARRSPIQALRYE